MHELQVTDDILNTVLEHARANDVRRVVRIHLEVGELADMKAEWLQRYLDLLSKDTIAEGAVVEVHTLPAGFLCHGCGNNFDVKLELVDSVLCPECGGKDCSLERGREFRIRDMEVV